MEVKPSMKSKWVNTIQNVFDKPFARCVHFLRLLGKRTGLTYQQISVVFNLWIQGGVLVLSAAMPLLQFVDHSRIYPNHVGIGILSEWYKVTSLSCIDWMCWFIFLVLYFLIYVGLYIWMLRHYRLPFNAAFNRCVDDLQKLAHEWNCSYQLVNLIIFIFLFLMVIGLNYLLVMLMMPTIFLIRI